MFLLGLENQAAPDSQTPWGIQLADKPTTPEVSAAMQQVAKVFTAAMKYIAKKSGRCVQLNM